MYFDLSIITEPKFLYAAITMKWRFSCRHLSVWSWQVVRFVAAGTEFLFDVRWYLTEWVKLLMDF